MRKLTLWSLAAFLGSIWAAGCGIPKEQHDKALAKNKALQDELDKARKDKESMQVKMGNLEQDLAKVKAKLKQIADLRAALAKSRRTKAELDRLKAKMAAERRLNRMLPVTAKPRCRCTKKCAPKEPDCATVITPGAKALWKHLTTGHWRRPTGKRSRGRKREQLELGFDSKDGELWISTPSLRNVGHHIAVKLCEIKRIRGGLALRLLLRTRGFGDLWAMLRDRSQPGPGSHPSITCCQVLKVRVTAKKTRIKIFGKSYRQVRPKGRGRTARSASKRRRRRK